MLKIFNPLIKELHYRIAKRKVNGKLLPARGYSRYFTDYYSAEPKVPYSIYRDNMLRRIRDNNGRQIVNKEGYPKTNTTEARYAPLRRMIKEGLLIMKRTNSISRYSNAASSYLVINKDKVNDE